MTTVTITFEESNTIAKDLLSVLRKTGAKVQVKRDAVSTKKETLDDVIRKTEANIKAGRYVAIKTEDLWK